MRSRSFVGLYLMVLCLFVNRSFVATPYKILCSKSKLAFKLPIHLQFFYFLFGLHENRNDNIHHQNSLESIGLLDRALQNLKCLPEKKSCYITLNQEDLDEFSYKKGDTEGLVNYGLTIRDINFAVIFIEQKDEKIIKISFRSKGDFDVNEFAKKYFNGGGHKNAAGGRSDINMSDTIDYFLQKLDEFLA